MSCPDGYALASVNSREEQIFLGSLSNFTGHWIGARRPTDDVAFTWSDGSAYQFSAWTNDPSAASGEVCARFNDPPSGGWVAESCSNSRHALCKKETDSEWPASRTHSTHKISDWRAQAACVQTPTCAAMAPPAW